MSIKLFIILAIAAFPLYKIVTLFILAKKANEILDNAAIACQFDTMCNNINLKDPNNINPNPEHIQKVCKMASTHMNIIRMNLPKYAKTLGLSYREYIETLLEEYNNDYITAGIDLYTQMTIYCIDKGIIDSEYIIGNWEDDDDENM